MRDWLLIPTAGGLVRIATWYTPERPVVWTWRRMMEKTRVIWQRTDNRHYGD